MAVLIGDSRDNTLVGLAERDLIRGLGGDDRLFGRAGNDTIEGGFCNDTLRGEGGSDLLRGGAGRDWLYGGSGQDVLAGGLGRDFLRGGTGADTFSFDDRDAGDVTAGRADVILDFSVDDIIDLSDAEIFSYSGFYSDPGRGAFGIWQAQGSTYVTWNTANDVHDIELRGYLGDLADIYNQIIWYDDDYRGGLGTDVTIADGETKAGSFEVSADDDWFRIDLTEGRLYTFDLKGAASGEGTAQDTLLELYDANGYWVSDAYGGDQDARMVYEADVSGTYYVRADSWSESGLGTYHLSVSSRIYVDDFGDSPETAGEIAPGDPINGEIGVSGDVDYFHLELEAGKTYTIDLQGADSDSGTLADPFLIFIDPTDVSWFDDDSGDGFDARFVFTAEDGGDAYIEASSFGWATGTYELSVAVEDPLVA
jgi:hypothetical protein